MNRIYKRGYKLSKEHKKKISEKMKIRGTPYIMTEAIRRKISDAKKGIKFIHSGSFKKGRVVSEEVRNKISEAQKRIGNKPPSRKGIKMSIESRTKMSNSRRGANNYLWKGGRTPLRKLIRENYKYRLWRKAIFERDNYICVLCKNKSSKNNYVYLQVDHYPMSFYSILENFNIKTNEEALYCEELWNLNNGRTLCVDCHKKTDNYGRKKRMALQGM